MRSPISLCCKQLANIHLATSNACKPSILWERLDERGMSQVDYSRKERVRSKTTVLGWGSWLMTLSMSILVLYWALSSKARNPSISSCHACWQIIPILVVECPFLPSYELRILFFCLVQCQRAGLGAAEKSLVMHADEMEGRYSQISVLRSQAYLCVFTLFLFNVGELWASLKVWDPIRVQRT